MKNTNFKTRLLNFYHAHEKKAELSFFLGGFVFDVFTLAEVNDYFSIIQQCIYLIICAIILIKEISDPEGTQNKSKFSGFFWEYRKLILHFILGSLLSIYSLYFLLSSSFFSSLIFVLFLFTLMVLNEVKVIQDGLFNIKVALYTLCLICFFALLWPVLLGFVGLLPFALSMTTTTIVLYYMIKAMNKKSTGVISVQRYFIFPSAITLGTFVLFYFLKLIPPVPISLKHIGVYHHIEKRQNDYVLSHERPWWRFWHKGDQLFYAKEKDSIYVFAKISSPAGFSDNVMLHWFQMDKNGQWLSTDKIPMNIKGGRSEGFRGYAFKRNFTEGSWRVNVETTDEREIGRIYFKVEQFKPDISQNINPEYERDFFKEIH